MWAALLLLVWAAVARQTHAKGVFRGKSLDDGKTSGTFDGPSSYEVIVNNQKKTCEGNPESDGRNEKVVIKEDGSCEVQQYVDAANMHSDPDEFHLESGSNGGKLQILSRTSAAIFEPISPGARRASSHQYRNSKINYDANWAKGSNRYPFTSELRIQSVDDNKRIDCMLKDIKKQPRSWVYNQPWNLHYEVADGKCTYFLSPGTTVSWLRGKISNKTGRAFEQPFQLRVNADAKTRSPLYVTVVQTASATSVGVSEGKVAKSAAAADERKGWRLVQNSSTSPNLRKISKLGS